MAPINIFERVDVTESKVKIFDKVVLIFIAAELAVRGDITIADDGAVR